MSVQILGLKEINGPLVVLDNVDGVSYDEMAEAILEDGSHRLGRVASGWCCRFTKAPTAFL